MQRTFMVVGVVVLLVVATVRWGASAEPAAEKQPVGVLGVLKPGSRVALREVGDRFEINTFEGSGLFQNQEVVEVNSDYVVLRDISGVTQARIPVYSIRNVVTFSTAKP
jgi:hypothetical protein